MPVTFLQRLAAWPMAFSMEIQIEGIKSILILQRLDPHFKYTVVLTEAMKYQHGDGTIPGLGVMQAAVLIFDEILLDEHLCKDGEMKL